MYLYTHAPRGAPLCRVDEPLFQACPRKPRAGVSGALWRLSIGTDVNRIYIFCFQMCNRLPELMNNGDAGVFPVYYSRRFAGLETCFLPVTVRFFLFLVDKLRRKHPFKHAHKKKLARIATLYK